MDCPSEEQMIRMKLADLNHIQSLIFDIANRQLTVYHTGNYENILQRLDSLQFDTSLIETIAAENYINTDNSNQEKKLLWQVLIINAFFFALEIASGIISHSMGLVADSLDMLADSIVYGLALWAVSSSVSSKKYVAKLAGYFQLMLAGAGLIETLRRCAGFELIPAFQTMISVSVLALIGNSLCLYLLQKSKNKEAHIQASMIFTSNDVLVNIGVILAGTLVYITNSTLPDLIIGLIVFVIVAKGAFNILKLSR